MSSRILGNVWDACAAHDIKGAKLLIMARLADYSNDDGISYPSVETICRQLGLGESTVRSAISELEAAGWLSREFRRRGNRNSSNKYYLNAERLEMYARTEKDKVKALKEEHRNRDSFHPPESEGSESDPLKSEGSDSFHPPESGKNGVFTLQNLDPDPQGLKHDPQVNSKHDPQDIGASADAPAPARSAKQDYSPEFETAWQAYPKRAGGNSKAAAFKAWKARLKDGVKPEDMLAGVKRYAIYCQTTGNTGTQYVRQAATFFGPDRHFEESWQTPSAPGGGRRNVLPVSGFSEQDYGESGCQW
ncbi:TPA: GntR family transcriptional regulator [Salmonella enterica]|uniref:GntR family transcriptional regulator n=2 Tax=Salmonella enterica TaxID=28901 RepID=A0A750EBD0_SALER|nr:helix-turn-helix domain-containing protein [Salmonella enterica subsp. enterica serovar Richmond]EAU4929762.1 helix-turn-helix domain-containing protein [Salmonella enterica]ECF2558608.1 helix-turn-helix domain-containing protein [Salmonella enterica subsp. enterica serovar Ahuza]ECF6044222.1 GntR family transcriptional regulator [Salmonella enterica subsp. salamae]EEB8306974.1 GntR family transcriptional regulator [Salmonella enterica subsp. enterica serovar Oslo]